MAAALSTVAKTDTPLILFPALAEAARKISFHTSGNKAKRREEVALDGRQHSGTRSQVGLVGAR